MINEVVILADGEFPSSPHLIKELTSAEFLICCDGAINSLVANNIEPDLVIGDLDSINANLKHRFASKLVHIPSQDSNDLTKAADWARNKGYKNVKIYGATGKRDDHSIANIFLLRNYSSWFDSVQIVSDYGWWQPINKTTQFDSFAGQQVSIFSSSQPKPLFSSGLRYPLNGLILSDLYMGTLNESLGSSFELIFDEGEFIVFQTSQPKY